MIDIFLTSSFPTYFHIYDATEELIKCATDIPAKFGTKTRERIRLAYFKNSHKNSVETIDGFSTREMVREDLIKIDEFKLDLENRFWNGPADTLKNSLAQIVIDKDSRPVSICYAAAVENRIAEIDVFTSERYRGKGLAKLAVEAFVNNCVAKNIKPTWDCFEDNTASKKTALSLGFDKIQEYNFLSIYNIIK
ncbi:MAG: GNAT family N-acetyltransferase [Bacteroidetes bacterium]|nr:GNAT family N-acetyltransferase [Bacteroidota bacterium]